MTVATSEAGVVKLEALSKAIEQLYSNQDRQLGEEFLSSYLKDDGWSDLIQLLMTSTPASTGEAEGKRQKLFAATCLYNNSLKVKADHLVRIRDLMNVLLAVDLSSDNRTIIANLVSSLAAQTLRHLSTDAGSEAASICSIFFGDEVESATKMKRNVIVMLCINELPQVVTDKRLTISWVRRIALLKNVLIPQLSALLAVTVNGDGISIESPPLNVDLSVIMLQSISGWIRCAVELLSADPVSVNAVLETVVQHPIIGSLETCLVQHSASVAAADLFELLCSSLCYYTCPKIDLSTALIQILCNVSSHIESACAWSSNFGTPNTDLSFCLITFYTCFRALAKCNQLMRLLYSNTVLEPTLKLIVVRSVAFLARTNCVTITGRQTQLAAVESLSAFLSHYMELFTQPDAAVSSMLETQRKVLQPLLNPIVSTLYPFFIPFNSHWPLDEWLNFRTQCAVLLTDLSVVLDSSVFLERAGGDLEVWAANSKKNGANPSWVQVEAAFFLLTSAAARAPAGSDCRIPFALSLVTDLKYPQEPTQGMLMRVAAARLVLWTSGFVGSSDLFPRLAQELLDSLAFFANSKAVMATDFGPEVTRDAELVVVETLISICTSFLKYRNKQPKTETEKPTELQTLNIDVGQLLSHISPPVAVSPEVEIVSIFLRAASNPKNAWESRRSLIGGAAVIFRDLPVEETLKFHTRLAQELERKAGQTEALRLLFAFSESVCEHHVDIARGIIHDYWNYYIEQLSVLNEHTQRALYHLMLKLLMSVKRELSLVAACIQRWVLVKSQPKAPAYALAAWRSVIRTFGCVPDPLITSALSTVVEQCCSHLVSTLR